MHKMNYEQRTEENTEYKEVYVAVVCNYLNNLLYGNWFISF